LDRNRLRSIKMSTTTWTLICGEHGNSERAKYTNSVDYETYPEQVSFEIEGFVSPDAPGRGVMVTSSWPNGTKQTIGTISTEEARQLWKQWVDKGYNRWLTQKT